MFTLLSPVGDLGNLAVLLSTAFMCVGLIVHCLGLCGGAGAGWVAGGVGGSPSSGLPAAA